MTRSTRRPGRCLSLSLNPNLNPNLSPNPNLSLSPNLNLSLNLSLNLNLSSSHSSPTMTFEACTAKYTAQFSSSPLRSLCNIG
jgi:hypothetical protein